MVATDGEEDQETMNSEEGVSRSQDYAYDADEEIWVGQKGEEGINSGSDIKENEYEVFGHNAMAVGTAVPEIDTDRTSLRMGCKDVVDAPRLFIPKGLELGKDGVFFECINA